eukprot:5714804-Prymnesium_polylepis.1
MEFDERVAPLRAADLSIRGTKAARTKLRVEHGEFLVRFARKALVTLAELSKDPSGASDATDKLLGCACEAAHFVLALGVLKSPDPEKLCYNASARCLALRQYQRAAELARGVMYALRREEES